MYYLSAPSKDTMENWVDKLRRVFLEDLIRNCNGDDGMAKAQQESAENERERDPWLGHRGKRRRKERLATTVWLRYRGKR